MVTRNYFFVYKAHPVRRFQIILNLCYRTLCQVVATEVKELEFVCQDGEKFGEDSCFLAPGASFAGSYDDAVQFCSANGMQLAAVHSQEEHDFVKS